MNSHYPHPHHHATAIHPKILRAQEAHRARMQRAALERTARKFQTDLEFVPQHPKDLPLPSTDKRDIALAEDQILMVDYTSGQVITLTSSESDFFVTVNVWHSLEEFINSQHLPRASWDVDGRRP